MKSILVDTDILIEVLRERDASILTKWKQLLEGDAVLLYSPVTLAEVLQGVRHGEQASVDAAFAAMVCVSIDAEIGRIAGNYLRKFRASHSLEVSDALIAGTAAAHGLTLWTRNRKHYPMSDLKLI